MYAYYTKKKAKKKRQTLLFGFAAGEAHQGHKRPQAEEHNEVHSPRHHISELGGFKFLDEGRAIGCLARELARCL